MRVAVAPQMYEWAIERSQRDMEELCKTSPKLPQWIAQEQQPTFKQLEKFAKSVYLPAGYFFSSTPPDEPLPISDFRTMGDRQVKNPSPHLLDTIYDCQQRQEWYIEYCRLYQEDTIPFVGSLNGKEYPAPEQAASDIRKVFFAEEQKFFSNEDAFNKRRQAVEDQGILVMCTGIAKGNTHRPLNIKEFRGFTLSNEYAPIIFINGRDTAAARSFTLIHELAHIGLGESGISGENTNHKTEKWCNAVASEVLIPLEEERVNFDATQTLMDTVNLLAKNHRVSTLAILLRLRDAKILKMPKNQFWAIYEEEENRIKQILKNKKGSGGDFYKSKPYVVSKRFLTALAISTLEGRTLYRDAMRLINVKKTKTFDELAHQALGM